MRLFHYKFSLWLFLLRGFFCLGEPFYFLWGIFWFRGLSRDFIFSLFYFQVSGYDFAAPGFKTAQDKAVSVLFHLRRDFRLRRVFLDLSRTFAGYK